MKFQVITLITTILLFGCGQSGTKEIKPVSDTGTYDDAKVMVYYFHGKQRCPSCIAIQKVTEDAYVNFLAENANVKYKEVDISLKENEALAEKYEIAWSSLIIAADSEYKNLTEDAFRLALRNPEGLSDLIVKETNALLNNNSSLKLKETQRRKGAKC